MHEIIDVSGYFFHKNGYILPITNYPKYPRDYSIGFLVTTESVLMHIGTGHYQEVTLACITHLIAENKPVIKHRSWGICARNPKDTHNLDKAEITSIERALYNMSEDRNFRKSFWCSMRDVGVLVPEKSISKSRKETKDELKKLLTISDEEVDNS